MFEALSVHTQPTLSYDSLTDGQRTMGLELAGVGLTAVDYLADTVTPDVLAAELFGLEANRPVSRAEFHARIHPADWPLVAAEVDKLLDPDFDDVIEVTHRTIAADGSTRWVHARKRLYRDETDPGRRVTTAVAAILDITARREAQERTGFLIRELQHRTSNVVTVISVIARMVMRTGEPVTFLDRFLPRLEALSARLKLVDVTTAPGLRDAVNGALEPFVFEPAQLVIDGPDVRLTSQDSQTYAMIVHELATNAVKYGAWSRIGGRVTISWAVADDGDLTLSWREEGGPPVAEPLTKGFGTQVLQRFAAATLGGEATVSYDAEGLRYELSVPRGN